MAQIELRLITNILEIFFVIYVMNIVQDRKHKWGDFLICILLYFFCFFLLEDNDWRVYIIRNVYLLSIFVVYLLKYNTDIRECLPLICILLSLCGIVKMLISVFGAFIVLIITVEHELEQIIAVLSSIFFMAFFVGVFIYILQRNVIDIKFTFSKKCMAYFIYFLVVCGKIPFLYTDIQYGIAWKLVFISIICCTVIFLIISRIERHNAEKERALIEENNKILSTKLHKSQEILPAMVQVFSDVVENGGTEMEGQHAQKLLEEVSDLYGQQLKENSKEDLQLKNFCSTGLKLLDEQLKVYQMEASDRNVNLDIFVQAPINGIMKKGNIDQLKFQRTVGDLVRNAFHALKDVDKEHRTSGHILLIIGCRYEEILEVAVVDNGEYFPLHVIEAFGKRGVTTGGTGNGLADLVEFADETQATICVEEFAWETNSFTKKVSIIFDKQRMNYFNSPRKASVESAFWNKN